MDFILRVVCFVLGGYVVIWTLTSAIRTFVLPRSDNVFLTRLVFQSIFRVFQLRIRWAKSYTERDWVMGFFSPVALLVLPVVWLTFISLGYMLMFWAVGERPWYDAYLLSGSSLLTLGFASVDNLAEVLLAFSEATIGLGLIAVLISYLPTMFSAFSEREAAVSMLEIYASTPPSATEMLKRMHRIHGLEYLTEIWKDWERWFIELEQTHTSLIPLVFFRSSHVGQSWVITAGTVLDVAALRASTLDMPRDPKAELCIRAGYLALQNIVDFFRIPFNPNPRSTDAISVTRAEYMTLCQELVEAGLPLKPDLDQAWRDFAGWRVNYDRVLLVLAGLTMAPEAPWSGDRALRIPPQLFFAKGKGERYG
ncbi:MAG TPA: hypothetical protein P5526_00370 [Anaerolineae bacterium]|nr:hypothetical protein [Anaerolineae bacterium]HRV90598.1 hypothetical protein [Anaerolineae bacterium]